jgi:C-lobe and N-lobe beta barrels of Tf-binding protein B
MKSVKNSSNIFRITSTCALLASLAVSNGCVSQEGGSTPPIKNPPLDQNSYTKPLDPSSNSIGDVSSYGIEISSSEILTAKGTINFLTGRIELESLSGDLIGPLGTIELDTGGSLNLVDSPGEYVEIYNSQGTIEGTSIGIIGSPTIEKYLPAVGTASYVGEASALILDGTYVYELQGKSSVTANFTTGIATINISNLSGTVSNGLGEINQVSDVLTITLSNALVVGNQIYGATVEFSNSSLSATLSGHQETVLQGGVFGPSADEVGGVFIIDDQTNGGSILVDGWFVAD